jgi:hypothetical protein
MIHRKIVTSLALLCLCPLLNSCTLFPDNDDSHHRTCSELKHRMMFSNGAGAMDQNQAFSQRAEQGKLNQTYHDENCV